MTRRSALPLLAPVAVLLVTGCAAVSSRSAAPRSPGASPSEGATPAPRATFDASGLASAGDPPLTTERSRETADGVTTVDLAFGPEGGRQTDAYLVLPEGGEPGPAILFFHWLETGDPTSNRTEFLDEAQELARRGAVSLLVDGTFPWKEDPSGIDHDVAALQDELTMLRQAADLLLSRPEVDPQRVALVGHDFGAMYSSVLFGADASFDGLVMMAPTARWADWYLRYWSITDDEDAYLAATAPYDPVTWLPRAGGRPILLQFASNDRFVSQEVADAIAAAAGSTAEVRSYDATHHLDDEARADRVAWLSQLLGLSAG